MAVKLHYPRRKMVQRPNRFTLNRRSPLANGLVFAGLGQFPGSNLYKDSSLYGNHGTLTGMNPLTDWVRVPTLGRWAVNSKVDAYIGKVPACFTIALPMTVSVWVRPNAASGNYEYIYNFTTYSTSTHLISLAATFGGEAYYYENAARQTTGLGLAAGTWKHILVVYKSATSVLCFGDGKAVTIAQPTAFAPVNAPQVCIGSLISEYSSYPFLGLITDPMLFRGDLSWAAPILADPSNVDYRVGGIPLIEPVWRRVYATAVAPPAGNRRRRLIIAGAYR